jgi:hypothetical protein
MRLYIPSTLPAEESQLIGRMLLARTEHQAAPQLVYAPMGQVPPHARWFSYINNPDGTVRWFWPKGQRFPAHLGLYNSASWKAKLYRKLSRWAFFLGLSGKLASGHFAVEAEEIPLEEQFSEVAHDSYGVFTGTPGKNRKTIVSLANRGQTTHFLKLAHTDRGCELLRRERMSLIDLQTMNLKGLVLPQVFPRTAPSVLIQSNVQPKGGFSPSQLTDLHVQAMTEWYRPSFQQLRLGDWDWFQQLGSVIQQLELQTPSDPDLNEDHLQRLLQGMQEGLASLDPDLVIPMARTHGDFTPWNQYHTAQAVHLYDWELSQAAQPMLYDWFHFIYQSGILLQQATEAELADQIRAGLNLPATQTLIDTYDLQVDQLHVLYLLQVISYYLPIYFVANPVHMQVHWLLRHWATALAHALEVLPRLTPSTGS